MSIHKKPFYRKEILVDGERCGRSYPIELSIETLTGAGCKRGIYRPDCRVGHFGLNFWLRTNAGRKYQAYKTERGLERAVEQLLKKHGFIVLGWQEGR